MAIRVYCKHCGQRIKAQDDMGGMSVRCPTCSESIQIPKVALPPAPPAPPEAVKMKTADLFDPQELAGSVSAGAPAPPRPTGVHPAGIRAMPGDDNSQPLNRVIKKKIFQGSLYALFLLGFIPLAYHTFLGENDTPLDRLEKSINELSAARREVGRQLLEDVKKGRATLDSVIEMLPDQKAIGAWLPRDTDLHYHMAGVSFVAFIFMLVICLPRGTSRFAHTMIVAIFTGTFGIGLLLLLQFLAITGLGLFVVPPFGFIIYLIGESYKAALDPSAPFIPTFLGFTFGVGLCEEIIKALPIFVIFLGRTRLRWHHCCALGMASGIGFGIAEGIHYSSQFYNGLFGRDMYFIRFASCTMLHAVWCGAAALFLHRYQRITHGRMSVLEFFSRLLLLIAIPMVLHGLYDTLLKKEIDGLALTVAVFSFGWLALMIETAREREGDILVEVPALEVNPGITMTPLHEDFKPGQAAVVPALDPPSDPFKEYEGEKAPPKPPALMPPVALPYYPGQDIDAAR